MPNDPLMTHQGMTNAEKPNDEGLGRPVLVRHWGFGPSGFLGHWWGIGGAFGIPAKRVIPLRPPAVRAYNPAQFRHAPCRPIRYPSATNPAARPVVFGREIRSA